MSKFVLTAQLQLRAPTNTQQVIDQLRAKLKGLNIPVKVTGGAQAAKQIKQVTQQTQQATTAAQKMGKAFGASIKRFAAFNIATRAVGLLASKLASAVDEAIEFQRQLVKISQVTGKTTGQLSGLTKEITRLATTLGVSSTALLQTTRVLAQAGIKAGDLKIALAALAKSTLAPTFDDITQTAEGAVAILAQFGQGVGALEKQLGAINAVSKQFAVESGDLISSVRRMGGVFKSAGGNLNELIGLFTSVRATTRENAESIATGLRTIFTRIQRPATIAYLKQLGVELTDVSGKFVGPFEAVKRLSQAFADIPAGDLRFVQIAEQLGGFRQIGKVIPLIQQFETAERARQAAVEGGNSLNKDAATAQQALAVQIEKTREKFLALIRGISETASFQIMIKSLLGIADAFISIAEAIKPLIPLITVFAGIKLAKGIGGFASGLGAGVKGKNQGGKIHAFASGGSVPGSGNRDTVPAMLTPGEFVIRKSSVGKIGAGTLAAMNENKYAGGGLVVNKLDSNKFAGLFARPRGKDSSGKLIAIPPKQGREGDDVLATIGAPKSYFIGGVDEETFTAKAEQQLESGINDLVAKMAPKSQNKVDKNIKKDIGFADIAGKIFEGVSRTIIGDFRPGKGSQQTFDVPAPGGKSPILTELSNLFNAGKQMPNIDYDNKLTESLGARLSLLKKAIADKLYASDKEIKIATFTGAGKNLSTRQITQQQTTVNNKGTAERRIKDLQDAKKRVDTLGLDKETSDVIQSRLNGDIKKLAQYREKTTVRTAGKKKTKTAALGGAIVASDAVGFAKGGSPKGSDTVPAMLTPGEFVVNKKSSQSIGYGNLNKMNKQGVVGFASGGPVGVQKFAAGGGVGGGAGGMGMQLVVLTTALGALTQVIEKFGDKSEEATQKQAAMTIGAESLVKSFSALIVGLVATFVVAGKIKKWGDNIDKTTESTSGLADAEKSAAESISGGGGDKETADAGGGGGGDAGGGGGEGSPPKMTPLEAEAASSFGDVVDTSKASEAADIQEGRATTPVDQRKERKDVAEDQAAEAQTEVQTAIAEEAGFEEKAKGAGIRAERDSKTEADATGAVISGEKKEETIRDKSAKNQQKQAELKAAQDDQAGNASRDGQIEEKKRRQEKIKTDQGENKKQQAKTTSDTQNLKTDLDNNLAEKQENTAERAELDPKKKNLVEQKARIEQDQKGVKQELKEKAKKGGSGPKDIEGMKKLEAQLASLDAESKTVTSSLKKVTDQETALVAGEKAVAAEAAELTSTTTRLSGEQALLTQSNQKLEEESSQLGKEQIELEKHNGKANKTLKTLTKSHKSSTAAMNGLQSIQRGLNDEYTNQKVTTQAARIAQEKASTTSRASTLRMKTANMAYSDSTVKVKAALTRVKTTQDAVAKAGKKLASATSRLISRTKAAVAARKADTAATNILLKKEKQLTKARKKGAMAAKVRKGVGRAGAVAAKGAGIAASVGMAAQQITGGISEYFERELTIAKKSGDAGGAVDAARASQRAQSTGDLFTAGGMIEAFGDPEGFVKKRKEREMSAGATAGVEVATQQNAKVLSDMQDPSSDVNKKFKGKDGGVDFQKAEMAISQNTGAARSAISGVTNEVEKEKLTQELNATVRSNVIGFAEMGATVAETDRLILNTAGGNVELTKSLKAAAAAARAVREAQLAVAKANYDSLKITSTFNAANVALKNFVGSIDGTASALDTQLATLEASQSNLGIDAGDAISDITKQLQTAVGGENTKGGKLIGRQAEIATAGNEFGLKAARNLGTLDLNQADSGQAKQQLEERLLESAKGKDGKIDPEMASVIAAEMSKVTEKNVGTTDISAVIKRVKEQVGQLSAGFTAAAKAFNESNKIILQLTQRRRAAELQYIAAQKQSIAVQLEAAKIIEQFGGEKVTPEDKKAASISQFNLGATDAGVGGLTTGSGEDIANVGNQIATALQNQIAKGATPGGFGTQTDRLSGDRRKELQAAQKELINFAKQRAVQLKEELEIVQKKNKLEKDSLEKAVSGDIEGFLKGQAAAGAASAVRSGNQNLQGLFGGEAMGTAFKDAKSQGLPPEELAKFAKVALASAGITDNRAVGVLSGSTPEEQRIMEEGQRVGQAMGGVAQQSAQVANMQVEAAQVVINAATIKRDDTLTNMSQKLARGGPVYANRGIFVPRGTDTVPAMLTPGEFVVNRASVQRGNNLAVLQAMNNNQQSSGPAMNRGGSVRYYGNGSDGGVQPGGGGFSISPETVTSLNNAFSGFSTAVDKLVGMQLSVKLDATNVNVNFSGTSFLANLTDTIRTEVLAEVKNQIPNIKQNMAGESTHSTDMLA